MVWTRRLRAPIRVTSRGNGVGFIQPTKHCHYRPADVSLGITYSLVTQEQLIGEDWISVCYHQRLI